MSDLVLLLTAKDAAKALSISERKLWSMTNAGEIPCVRIGRAIRYDPDDLRRWISKSKRKSTGSIDADSLLHSTDPEPVKDTKRRKKRAQRFS